LCKTINASPVDVEASVNPPRPLRKRESLCPLLPWGIGGYYCCCCCCGGYLLKGRVKKLIRRSNERKEKKLEVLFESVEDEKEFMFMINCPMFCTGIHFH